MPSFLSEHPRLNWLQINTTPTSLPEGDEILKGLHQIPKTLPCRYFYDDYGSELFEQICDLPEYYPTRTEQRILETYAREISELTGACELVELGSGSSRKTRLLLEAYLQVTPQLHYCPIDVSAGILKSTALDLLHRYPTLRLSGVAGTYEQALTQLPLPSLNPRLLIFLGSTMGNLSPELCDRFLTQVQQALKPGEYFLLGVDLQKPIEILEAAYNDAKGVTAAFNLNILRHLNYRFQGNFDLNHYQHLAFYNSHDHQIEMYLRSIQRQTVTLEALDAQVTLQLGESIRTEISRKFHLPTLAMTLEAHALKPINTWTDAQSWFGLLLCQRQCIPGECP